MSKNTSENSYVTEFVDNHSIEFFGKCVIPKLIMKQEKIQSGDIILLQTEVFFLLHCLVELPVCCYCMGKAYAFQQSHSSVSLFCETKTIA